MRKYVMLAGLLSVGTLFGQFVSTNADRITTDFSANWQAGTYPRLLGNAADWARVKSLYDANNGLVRKSIDRIVVEANTALTKNIPNWALDDANLRVTSVHTLAKEFVPQLTIAYRITGDQRYARRAWEVAKVLYNYPDWGVGVESPWRDRHFLDTGIGGYNVAMLYDGLSGWASSAQKDSLFRMARKFVIYPALKQYRGEASKNWSWMYANNNWNGICNGGVIAACLTMMEHEPALCADVASRAINCLPNYINAFEPDGQSEEGMMYWSYGLMYTVTTFDIMKRTLGTTYGYADSNGMKKTGYFPLFTSGPVVSINVGDDPLKNSRANSLFWFAEYHGDNNLAKLQYDLLVENNTAMPWYDLFHYLPEQVKGGEELTITPDNHTEGIDLFTFVERWKDRNAMFLSVHGGKNNANHGHLDAGSFDIQAFGEVFAYGNLGSDSYTNPGYFDFTAGGNDCNPSYTASNNAPTVPGAWHFYRKRAEGKNTIVYNSDYRADQNPNGEAEYQRFFNSSPLVGCGALNMNMIYNRDVNKHTRGFKLDRARRMIVVQDQIEAKAQKNIWWSLHTKSTVTLSSDRRTAILEQNGKRLRAFIRSPYDAAFQVLPTATYLEGRNFPLTKNSANGGFRKLCINLKDTKNTFIRVEFTPAEEAEPEDLFDDFEGFSYKYEVVNLSVIQTNCPNPTVDAVNPSALVLRHTQQAGAANYAGVKSASRTISIGLGYGQSRYLKMKLLKQSLGEVWLKLENGHSGATAEFLPVNAPTKVGEWEEFTFDLQQDVNGVSQLGRTYGLLFLMPDRMVQPNLTTYIDDIILSNAKDGNPENVLFSKLRPEALTYSQRTSQGVHLSWQPVSGAAKYYVVVDGVVKGTTTGGEYELSGLMSGATLLCSVTAENANGQSSLSSDPLSVITRVVAPAYELIDDAENPQGWDTPVASTLLALQTNPVKNDFNPSASCYKFTRYAYVPREVRMTLSLKDRFVMDADAYRYLHVKMYRSVNSGVQVALRNGSAADYVVSKPLNEADTLATAKWVDFVFDLSSIPSGSEYHTLDIYPDRAASWSSSKNYFVDDICLSPHALPFNGAFIPSLVDRVELRPVTAFYREGVLHVGVQGEEALQVMLFDAAGRQLLRTGAAEVAVGNGLAVPIPLEAGIYMVAVDQPQSRLYGKIIVR